MFKQPPKAGASFFTVLGFLMTVVALSRGPRVEQCKQALQRWRGGRVAWRVSMFRRASTSHPVVYAPLDRSLALSPFCLFLRALFLPAFLLRQPLSFFLSFSFIFSILAVGHRVVTCRDLLQPTFSRLRWVGLRCVALLLRFCRDFQLSMKEEILFSQSNILA